MILSTYMTLPITASAASTTYQSTLSTTSITLDGVAGTDEVWSSVDTTNIMKLDNWKSVSTDTTQIEATAANVPTVKIANDGDNVYFYLEADELCNDSENGDRIWFWIAFSQTEVVFSGEAYTDRTTTRTFTGGEFYVKREAADREAGAGVIEGKIVIPDTVKTTLAEGDVTVRFAVFLQNGRMADMSSGGWQNGFTTDGGYLDNDYTKGEEVTLKKAEPTSEPEAPIYPSTLAESPITIDGTVGVGEIWSSIDNANVLKLDAWKSASASTAVNATATNVPTVKIANDYEYLYIYLETDKFTKSNNDSGKRVWFTVDYGYSEGTDDLVHYQWFTDKERNAYDGSTAQYCVDFKETTPFSGGVIEAKFAIPNAVRNELSTKDVEIKLSVYLQNAMKEDMTTETGWEAGFTSSTGEFKGQTDATVGDRVLLKMAQPSASSLPINVSSVKTETPITIDGKATSGEIWSSVTAVKMSTWVNDITMVNRVDNAEACPTVKIANDGNFVYILYEASYMEKRSVSFQIGFNGANGIKGDAKNVLGEWVEIELWTDVDRGSKNTSSGLNTLKWNSEDAYAADSAMKQHTAWHIYNPSDSNNGSIEIRIPIPASVKSQISDGDVEITFSARAITQRWADNVSSDVPWTSGFVLLAGYTVDGSNHAAVITLKQAQPSEEIPAPDYGTNSDTSNDSPNNNNTSGNKNNNKNESNKKDTEDVTDTSEIPEEPTDDNKKDYTVVIIIGIAVVVVVAGAVVLLVVLAKKRKTKI